MKVQTTEGAALKDPNTKYYAQLCDRLDVSLVYTELGMHSHRINIRSYTYFTRCLRGSLRIQHPCRASRDSDGLFMLPYIHIHRIKSGASHTGHGPTKGQSFSVSEIIK